MGGRTDLRRSEALSNRVLYRESKSGELNFEIGSIVPSNGFSDQDKHNIRSELSRRVRLLGLEHDGIESCRFQRNRLKLVVYNTELTEILWKEPLMYNGVPWKLISRGLPWPYSAVYRVEGLEWMSLHDVLLKLAYHELFEGDFTPRVMVARVYDDEKHNSPEFCDEIVVVGTQYGIMDASLFCMYKELIMQHQVDDNKAAALALVSLLRPDA